MSDNKTPTSTKEKRPTTRMEILARRFRHARVSLAVEGLHLTHEEVSVFEECISKECSLEERTARLKQRFPHYDRPLRP